MTKKEKMCAMQCVNKSSKPLFEGTRYIKHISICKEEYSFTERPESCPGFKNWITYIHEFLLRVEESEKLTEEKYREGKIKED